MKTTILSRIGRSVLKIALSPILAMMSFLLYPSLMLRLFSGTTQSGLARFKARSKGKLVGSIYLPGNGDVGKKNALYAPMSWYSPFFSLEDHVEETIQVIQALDKEGAEEITVTGISMGGAAAIATLAELIKRSKAGTLTLNSKLKFFVFNTFNALENVILNTLNNGATGLFLTLSTLAIALPIWMASWAISIPSATLYVYCALGIPLMVLIADILIGLSLFMGSMLVREIYNYFASPDPDEEETPIIVWSVGQNVLMAFVILGQVACLYGTAFVYIPVVLSFIFMPMFANYTIPFLLSLLGSNTNIRECADYIQSYRQNPDISALSVELTTSQVAPHRDHVIRYNNLYNSLEADYYLAGPWDHHMSIPSEFDSLFFPR